MQEACAMLKANLPEEDILLIKQGKVDATDMHFSLGLWIRNNWIYKGLTPQILGLEDMFDDADDYLPFAQNQRTCFPTTKIKSLKQCIIWNCLEKS